jgi:pimeloyl-ACP methyl ester carboxylesterase/DNA-binding CsgD family transcriptional regulator
VAGQRAPGSGGSDERKAPRSGELEQEIRFCEVDGARVAYATVGSGPALLLPALWISHLELEWGVGELRAFIGGLARRRTVIRYDRLGTGLSDRPAGGLELTVAAEVRTVGALVDALGLDELSLLGISWGGCTAAAFAARAPERVRCVALVGAFVDGTRIAPAPLREALVATVRAHWGAGSRQLADVWVPGADAHTRERFARLQRAAASPEVAAAMLEAVYATDMREVLSRVPVPALVLHRREDRAMPFEQGRELAARLPHARLVALDGDLHPPWLGDRDAVLGALTAFLDAHHPARAAPAAGDGPLSKRECEVLRLVADGLSDAEIAGRLILSPHTVHRHVANIRTKLGQPSRAAAAAYAAREGLI